LTAHGGGKKKRKQKSVVHCLIFFGAAIIPNTSKAPGKSRGAGVPDASLALVDIAMSPYGSSHAFIFLTILPGFERDNSSCCLAWSMHFNYP
jgi:hypothetical protein